MQQGHILQGHSHCLGTWNGVWAREGYKKGSHCDFMGSPPLNKSCYQEV